MASARHFGGMGTTKLDLTGLKCPLPALRTRKALQALRPGDLLEVRCTDPMAAIDIPHLTLQTGDRIETIAGAPAEIVFVIERGGKIPL